MIYIVVGLYTIAGIFTIIFFDGTGGSGDSIYHYLHARYAPVHPEHFFDHWAKPLYVFLACPFAQFGFTGIKVFNLINALITIYFSYKIAAAFHLKNAILVSVFMFFSPLFYILTFSGLTEPLFATVLTIGIYLLLKQKHTSASILLSFLPFVRSEGMIILGVVAFFLIIDRKWRYIPYLIAGHVIYSVAGYFHYHDLLWVFNRNPYSTLNSLYGNGELLHYVDQLIYVVGVPLYILFWIGVLSSLTDLIRKRSTASFQTLIVLGFFSFLIAHSLFWYLGIFNSMGLKRVFVGVVPLMSIFALKGFNFITEELIGKFRVIKISLQYILVIYVIIFPFTSNPAALDFKTDMSLSTDQKCAIDVAEHIKTKYTSLPRLVYNHPYLSEVFNIDHFDHDVRASIFKDFKSNTKKDDVLIWDNWFCVIEDNIPNESLESSDILKKEYKCNKADELREVEFNVYNRQRKDPEI